MTTMVNKIAQMIATLFFVGHSPVMPGTCGSLVTALILFFLPTIPWALYFFALIMLFLIGWWAAGYHAKRLQKTDPSCIVIDELVGMMITLFVMPKNCIVYFVAFILFRFFDIVKPFPINVLEKKIQGGFGIMLDDVLAGCFAWMIAAFLFLR